MTNKIKGIAIAITAIFFLSLFSCKKDSTSNAEGIVPSSTTLTGKITQDTRLTADKKWMLNGYVYVNAGAKLIIEPGTVILGQPKSVLIIMRGAKIIAEGNASKPIVFTSSKEPGQRKPGDWGGLVICGKAPNNQSENAGIDGGIIADALHGGNDPHDNSGILKYVRVEYAGFPIMPDKEVNSFTFASVGDGTTVEYCQASYAGDDSFEWFGGTVNCKHLVAYHGWDDDFDTDWGFSGSVQYCFSVRHPQYADKSGSNGFESDNNEPGDNNSPVTSAVFANVTLLGPKKEANTAIDANFKNCAQLRRNTKLSIYNSILAAFPDGLYIDDAKPGAVANAKKDELQIRNVIITGFSGKAVKTTDAAFDVNAWFNTTNYGNKVVADMSSTGLNMGMFDLTGNLQVLPSANSILLKSAKWDNAPKGSFDKVAYIGAFGTEDWTKGWVSWTPWSNIY